MTPADQIVLDTETMQCLTAEQAWHYRTVPKRITTSTLECYADDQQLNDELVDELEMLTGKSITLYPVSTTILERALTQYYPKKTIRKKPEGGSRAISIGSGDFVLQLVIEAKSLDSSDIHIETYEAQCRVRMRIDGKLIERLIIQKEEYPALVNKIKIMANLDIAEKRLPQDGRIFFHQEGFKFDIRVSVVPTLHGEKIVLRLLGSDTSEIELSQLGFAPADLEHYLEGIRRPNGILLISGPTGSGKTTTLYATLKLLNEESRNILTIEDPIEYTLKGINQVQLKENIGLDFGRALRTFLRQDPDVIMVGEIRDTDTGNMAIRAALTGHLVLSTIHTNSAWGTVSRLVDMGTPSYLLANTLNTTVAQRLVRVLCPNCKQLMPFYEELYPKSFRPFQKVSEHYVARGCEQCYQTGYQGRKAIYEVVPIDATLSEKIKENEYQVGDLLQERGIKTLAENAFALFAEGQTSLEEIYPLLFNY
ncbi:GspE/PulE family protein [Tunicatimonas pelagia]|uniref:GspE/PulE family protein n=1 Tax=Tunicatimonas pelagia TaxID=931531 RepID=UPI002665E5AA|nr:GspE/PulE family protein [Tunicatimonas pelagia]WKN45346.1 GspE/PulE family protein [Tunicatimonas pelagia]